MTDQYTDAWIEFWTVRSAEVGSVCCPCCDELSYLNTCQHCGYDIAEHFDRQDRKVAQRIVERR